MFQFVLYARYRLTFAILVSLTVTSGAGLFDVTAAQAQQFDPYAAVKIYIEGQTNAYRKSKGIPALRMHSRGAAQAYADFLARNNATGHEADGKTPKERLVASGYPGNCLVWENVADYWSSPNRASSKTAADFALNFWKNSPGHRANLERREAAILLVGGAGWNHNGKHYYKFVQMFVSDCKPAEPPRPIQALGKRKV